MKTLVLMTFLVLNILSLNSKARDVQAEWVVDGIGTPHCKIVAIENRELLNGLSVAMAACDPNRIEAEIRASSRHPGTSYCAATKVNGQVAKKSARPLPMWFCTRK